MENEPNASEASCETPPPLKSQRTPESRSRRWGLSHFIGSHIVWFIVGMVLTASGVFIASVVITYIMPREYLGKVRLQIRSDVGEYAVSREPAAKDEPVPPNYLYTQMEIIRSRETLYKVIDEMQLVKRWEDAKTKADACLLLRGKIETKPIERTDLVDIEVYHTDPVEAADLANALARAYRERCNFHESSRSMAQLDVLNAQEELQVQMVENARLKMIELEERLKLVDLGNGPGFAENWLILSSRGVTGLTDFN